MHTHESKGHLVQSQEEQISDGADHVQKYDSGSSTIIKYEN